MKDKNQNFFFQIEYSDLIGKKFKDENFLEELNKWALCHKFKLRLSEGIKKVSKGYKRTLICNTVSCDDKIVFLSENGVDAFQVYEKLSQKYKTHSKDFFKLINL